MPQLYLNSRRRMTAIMAAATLAGVMGLPLTAQAQTTTTMNWQVQVGAADPSNPTVQGFGYYPEILTIDAGNTVTFSLGPNSEPHFVVFQDGAPFSATKPILGLAPGQSYGQGTVAPGLVNGAFLAPGYRYTLTFSTPGVYTYYCEIHGGQEGVIVVNPKGTPLPETPAQYQAIAAKEIASTLAAGDQAVGQHAVVTTVKNANGTETFEVPAGISPSQATTTALATAGGTSLGSVTLTPTASGLSVTGSLTGLMPNTSYQLAIDNGLAGYPSDGPIAANSTFSFTTDSAGNATISQSVANNPGPTSLVPPMAGWFLSLTQAGTTIAQANITNNNDASALAFVPDTIWIKPGDTVTWTEEAPQEAHTVTFLALGQAEPNPFSPPSGGSQVTGHSYYNSGLLTYGQSYSLTFTKPGVYPYECLLHNDFGMTGTVIVEPAPALPASNPATPPGPSYFSLLHHSVGQLGAPLIPAQRLADTLYYTYHVHNDQAYIALLNGTGPAAAQTIAKQLASTYHVAD